MSTRLPATRPVARRPARAAAAAPGTADFDRAVTEFFMRIALEEAQKAVGRTSPNPPVGAILVKGGRVIARGHTRQAGLAHAEVVALEQAGARARGADLYCTLEPCDHYGRTPPCSLAILEAGVRRVIHGSFDPNPLVDGKGVRRLRKAGVAVLQGVLREQTDPLYGPFFKVVRTGLPWVTLKAASTLDGRIATARGDSRWVTGEAARERVHHLRDRVDAVLVGANTARPGRSAADHPAPRRARSRSGAGGRGQPAQAAPDAGALQPALPRRGRSWRRWPIPRAARGGSLAARGVEVWKLRSTRQGQVSLEPLLRKLAAVGLNHVLCEGGGMLAASLLQGRAGGLPGPLPGAQAPGRRCPALDRRAGAVAHVPGPGAHRGPGGAGGTGLAADRPAGEASRAAGG